MLDSTMARIKEIVEEAQSLYEPGNQARCYAAVWRKHIYPRHRISYNTLLRYLAIAENGYKIEPTSDIAPGQLTLFNDEEGLY